MTKQSTIPVASRLHRPTLPCKKVLQLQQLRTDDAHGKLKPLREYVRLPVSGDSLAKCDEKTPMPRANLISETSSDDERKPTDDTTSSNISVSGGTELDSEETKLSKTPMTRTGVYFDNVEIHSDMHPLQCCCVQDGPLQACRAVKSMYGRPLSAAPVLPIRIQSCLRPLSFLSLQSKRPRPSNEDEDTQIKKQCRDIPRESQAARTTESRRVEPDSSRTAKVKEASFMIEAAVALANLGSSNA